MCFESVLFIRFRFEKDCPQSLTLFKESRRKMGAFLFSNFLTWDSYKLTCPLLDRPCPIYLCILHVIVDNSNKFTQFNHWAKTFYEITIPKLKIRISTNFHDQLIQVFRSIVCLSLSKTIWFVKKLSKFRIRSFGIAEYFIQWLHCKNVTSLFDRLWWNFFCYSIVNRRH